MIMKISFFLLFFLLFHATAVTIHGQDKSINVKMKDVIVRDVLKEIENKTAYRFFFSDNFSDIYKKVDINIETNDLSELLSNVFKNTTITYRILDNNMVVITPISVNNTMGQGIAVQGTITDKNGEPMPGVNIILKETSTGVVTNANGQYTVTVPNKDAVLVFSFIGYISQEIAVGSRTNIDVVLNEDIREIEEVVVVGYGTQKKINLTGSVSVINGESLVNKPVPNLTLALQGTTPGLTIFQTSGQPGQSGTVRIRGIGSRNAGDAPLVLIDNVERGLNDINVNDIASISILKDAAAASIYGSRASNGVILITTKRGEEGINVSYNGYMGWQRPTNMPDKVNALEHMKYYDIARANMGAAPKYTEQIKEYVTLGVDNFSRYDTDWEKLVLTGSGLLTNHSLSISSGTDRMKFLTSGNYMFQDGLTENTNYKRMDLRVNSDIKIMRNLNLAVDINLNNSNSLAPAGQSPSYFMRSVIGMAATIPGVFDTGEYGDGWLGDNPVAVAKSSGTTSGITNNNIISGRLTYNPFKGMDILVSYNTSLTNTRRKIVQKQYDTYKPNIVTNQLEYSRTFPATNYIQEETNRSRRDMFLAQIAYNKSIKNNNFSVMVGFTTEEFEQDNLNGRRTDMIDFDKPYLNMAGTAGQTVSGSFSDYALMSYYGRITYNYSEKYLLEVNGRYDGSSRFRKDDRWAFFPSFSVGWRISQESFWDNLRTVVNNAKIRFSIGDMGNQSIGNYPTYSALGGGGYMYYFDRQLYQGYVVSTAANTDLTWENSRQYDIGLDLNFFNNRLGIVADYYKRDITNMLLDLPIPAYVGVAAPYVNIGSMYNKGWELAIDWKEQISDFKYNIVFTLADVQNKVTDLGGEEYIGGNQITRKGHNLYSYYGYKADGLFQTQDEINDAPVHFSNTKPGDIRYQNVIHKEGDNPKGIIDADDRVVLGNHMPRFEYGLTLGAEWKGFDISIFLQGVGKRDNYLSGMGTRAFYAPSFEGTMYEYQKDYWTEENKGASYPRLTVDSDNNYQYSSYWIKSGAYLRVKNLVIGYTIPQNLTKKIGINSCRIYASGQNLLTFDNFFEGFDPEIPNSDGQFYPIMRTLSFGVNLNF